MQPTVAESGGSTQSAAETVQADPAFWGQWYYSIELAPGLYTAGQGHQNIALTRELLGRVDVEGAGGCRALDIGTYEGLVPILLERRGASALAYDRTLQTSRLELVQRSFRAEFELLGDFKLSDAPQRLRTARTPPPYDLVVLSGVLYHMLDPMTGLAVARGLVRNGGILLVETLATFEERVLMHFNVGSRMGPNALWAPSVPCLDYLLRFMRLEVIDAVRLGPWQLEGAPDHGRVAVACRALPEPVAEPGDPRITAEQFGDDINFAEFLDWEAVKSDSPPLGYAQPERPLVKRDSGTGDLLATVMGSPAHEVTLEQIRLDLGATR